MDVTKEHLLRLGITLQSLNTTLEDEKFGGITQQIEGGELVDVGLVVYPRKGTFYSTCRMVANLYAKELNTRGGVESTCSDLAHFMEGSDGRYYDVEISPHTVITDIYDSGDTPFTGKERFFFEKFIMREMDRGYVFSFAAPVKLGDWKWYSDEFQEFVGKKTIGMNI